MPTRPEAAGNMQARLSIPHTTPPPLGYDALTDPLDIEASPGDVFFKPNPAYEDYLRMHKVIVGQRGAERLLEIHESLRGETMPRYLSVAGWAATEAALIQAHRAPRYRLGLLEEAVDCWQRALETQRYFNASGIDALFESDYPHRIALDIAHLPLLRGLVLGDISPGFRRGVLRDCLNIAQANLISLDLAARAGDYASVGHHVGLGYEANGILAFNLRCSNGWFAIPSMARADTGYYYQDQTHDLLVIHHRRSSVLNITPVEVKSAVSARDRKRYRALLMRGKMHLSVEGRYPPDETLSVIEAVFTGSATQEELDIFREISDCFVEMVRDYYAGEALGYVATARSVTRFRNNERVVARYVGPRGVAV